jgi:cytochrome c
VARKRLDEKLLYVNYDLSLADGTVIHLSERPEYRAAAEGKQDGFDRLFYVEGLPEGATLSFLFNYHSLPAMASLKSNGLIEVLEDQQVQAKGLYAHSVKAQLTLLADQPTQLTTFFTKYPLIVNDNKVKAAAEEASQPLGARLIARSDCKSCHNTYVETIGPAYVSVAKRYENTEGNRSMLASKIKNGGAGNWGEAAMTPHPDLDDTSLAEMVNYIMSLDADEEMANTNDDVKTLDLSGAIRAESDVKDEQLLPGLFLSIYQFDKPLNSLGDVNFNKQAAYQGRIGNILVTNSEFKGLEANFALRYQGYLNIPKDNNYVFRLRSDDGSKLYIGNQLIIDHDGLHGATKKDGEISLQEGWHPIRVDFFQGAGGKYISLEWKSYDDDDFEIVPKSQFMHAINLKPEAGTSIPPMAETLRIPGDGYSLEEVHPSYTLSQARPDEFSPKVGGLDFMSDGRLIVSTWDAEGAVYMLEGVQDGMPEKMTYKKIAQGLAEPLGLKVIEDTIYVLQKQELTRLIDHDGDDIIDEYYTVSNDWKVSANFHEFAFGLAFKDDYFYAALAIAIMPGGASANPQIPDRGKAIRIHKNTGEVEFVASGLRTPNGVGIGVDNEIFIADNQGDWLPSSKIVHVTAGDFFGSRAVDSARVAQMEVKPPVVWLPQDEIGNSPSTPSYLNDGPYAGQMIHGEVTHGGIKRVFVEKVNGAYQGAVFRFIQGLEAGINRLSWGPDTALYVGGIGSTGNWGHSGKLWYGLQRLKYNGAPTFEMLAVRAKSNGFEIEFTEPLAEAFGNSAADYEVQQWWYLPTNNYGGPKLDREWLKVRSASVSDNRKKVFLEIEGLKPGHVVYFRLPFDWESESGQEIWSTEAWYTLNQIPENNMGMVKPATLSTSPNELSQKEKSEGWQLLFDGQTTDGWRNYRKQSIGSSWKVVDGTLMLDAKPRADGGWQAEDGGDIITDKAYKDFDLRLEWKIGDCGNSGIMFNVVESEDYDYVWNTGPEMQILDNSCHPDARFITHRAGCLYDMIPVKYESVRPAGMWNRVRIKSVAGAVTFWLNGRKVVEFEMFTPEWDKMIANSKFKDMLPGFGHSPEGHISLQDHGDPVWFRNIKIRTLDQ